MKHLTEADYSVSRWSGGSTTELAIGPEGARYADRDFLWRVSSATVDLETSEFTPLPDYERLIAPLFGTMVLSHNGGAPVTLDLLEVHAFSGGDSTHCEGKCTDFNLMLRRGCCEGRMTPVRLQKGERHTFDLAADTTLIYAVSGVCRTQCAKESVTLKNKESLLAGKRDGTVTVIAETETVLMTAEIKNL